VTAATAQETPTAVAQNQTTETAPAASTAPAATAAPAETAAPANDSSQNAAAPGDEPAAAPAQDKTQILFPEGSAELPPEATQQLDGLAQKLDQNQALRLQLMAYASGSEDTASRARRISLSRALAVRAYLIDKGVRSTRMDVRALGNKVEGDPADRVDIVTLTP
jgi:outer membrane protein OmpA-like peptidoglycan-associated protein